MDESLRKKFLKKKILNKKLSNSSDIMANKLEAAKRLKKKRELFIKNQQTAVTKQKQLEIIKQHNLAIDKFKEKKKKLLEEKRIEKANRKKQKENINNAGRTFIKNKTIYLTYHKNVPQFVFNNWKINNPSYKIEFSKNNDCTNFIKKNMNKELVNIFNKLERGAWKADLWRICKLYLNGGVYSDVDINPEPYFSLHNDDDDYDINFKLDRTIPKKATFISIISGMNHRAIFQALMIEKHDGKNNFILGIIIHFLQEYYFNNKKGWNWPTYNMNSFIRYNLNKDIKPFHNYYLNKIKIPIHIGKSSKNTKSIKLGWFPNTVKYTITLKNTNTNDYNLSIKNNHLVIEKKNNDEEGWNIDINSDIHIDLDKPEILYFFQEGFIDNTYYNNIKDIGVYNKQRQYILKSRYASYPF